MQLPSKIRVTAAHSLQLDEAIDCSLRSSILGVKIGRPVVSFDHRDGAAGLEKPPESEESVKRTRQVLEDEADEEVVECFALEGQRKNVRLPELHICDACGVRPCLCFLQR